ncbi:hypothetical protein GWI33_002746 [Rhynchophorus ferrugineus]|uniref:FLYWCH-type domain-containing protein n=1 Tax=Rhynchophorus ferrugineus TaxID=354439 RepID=A0A834IRH5_RHYFE|nr:hypothetical protein GWI33_002746 [Rhynchophorus ferrugineus]
MVWGYIFIGAGTKNPKIIMDNNDFTINTKQGTRTRWRCTQYFKTKCKATLVTYGRVVNVKSCHNHLPTNPNVNENYLIQSVTINRTPSLIYVVAGKKNPKIILEDNDFILNNKYGNKTTWRCRCYGKTGCKSRLTTSGKTVKIIADHNHDPTYPDTSAAVPQTLRIVKSYLTS